MRERLDPSVFRVQVDNIKKGYYSDKYFMRTVQTLIFNNHNPIVTYQFFVREPATVVGIDETIAMLKQCLWDGFTWKDLEVSALYDGDNVDPWEPFLVVRGPQQAVAHLETVLLGVIARPTATATATKEIVKAANNKPVLFFAARFDHYHVQASDGYAALLGGAAAGSTDANMDYWGAVGAGTIPHALIAGYGGNTAAAAVAFNEAMPENIDRIILVDFENDCIRTTIECVEAFRKTYYPQTAPILYNLRALDRNDVIGKGKNKIMGVRFDTSGLLVDKSVTPKDESSFGVCPELVFKARQVFDNCGLKNLKIIVSGGFTSKKVELFERLGVPVDMYGVGSSLLRHKIDVTADIVEVNGKPCAKVGRAKGDYSRLSVVK